MKVILTVAGLAPEDGGPSRSVPALATSLARQGLEVELVTCQSSPKQGAPLLPPAGLVQSHVLPHRCRVGRGLPRTNAFSARLRELGRGQEACVIHDNGLWLRTNHAAAHTARSLKKPLIISPRGMLSDWALQFKGLKKRIAWRLYQKRDLESAQVLHATSGDEAKSFRALGLNQPIALVPNGVELPDWHEPQWRTSEIRTVLFLSRIHPKKGLKNLVQAWSVLRPKNWRVVLAGEDANGHRAELEAAIRAERIETDFKFIGAVDGANKWDLYRSADLFVLPSHSENFGLAVAEALASGVPVITTVGAPWEDLRTHRCGWWVEFGVESLATALREGVTLSDQARSEMGRRGRRLVESKFSWPHIAGQMRAVYGWMVGAGEKPACII